MSLVLEIFKEITSIPRCSGTHNEFINYVKSYASKCGFECFIDDVNNILCKKKNSNSKICLQSHYDIVCLIDNTIPEIIEKDGFLKAKNSTLGADNGIGCSYMLALMSENKDLEYLFTSDEEIGLIGANDIKLNITSPFMLNLDSEEEGEICIGCAGGVDILAKHTNHKLVPNTQNLKLYEITISKLRGGHSGVNIHENIPNAIKLIAKAIKECGGKLLDLNGGERINSIPANAKAIIASKNPPSPTHENMSIKEVAEVPQHFNLYSDEIIDFLYDFENGVIEFNNELDVVETSINLAIVKTNINEIEIKLSARSMDNEKLNSIKETTCNQLKIQNFEVQTKGKYPAWKPDKNEFTQTVYEIYIKNNPDAQFRAIHAGLECAIFKEKFPHLKVASIGPNIYNPHSYNEKVSIKSVENLFGIVNEIIL
ncbi:MAG: M20/M25/M40 family metallo-hydrolase [Arcobacter sp.]|uniref:M20/M25/M40 family metallo-hydrolase n=1 Tax=Arcobacter sp. TaxID=1872629 RepID=UPI003B00679A